jgi:hypothetical protein
MLKTTEAIRDAIAALTKDLAILQARAEQPLPIETVATLLVRVRDFHADVVADFSHYLTRREAK